MRCDDHAIIAAEAVLVKPKQINWSNVQCCRYIEEPTFGLRSNQPPDCIPLIQYPSKTQQYFSSTPYSMHKAIIAAAALMAFSMIPSCPAPVGLIVSGLAAPLIGGLTYIGIQSNISPYGYPGAIGAPPKRSLQFPRAYGYPGVAQHVFDLCKNSNKGRRVHVQQTAENSEYL